MVRAGFKRSLQEKDGLSLPRYLIPESVHRRFVSAWDKEVTSGGRSRGPSLLRVLWIVLGSDLKLALATQLGVVVVKFSCVLLVRRLVQITADEDPAKRPEGIIIAALLCTSSACEGLLASNAAFRLQLALVGLSSCYAHAVLRKGMVLHPDVQEGYKRGDLVNLALSDCNRLFELSLILIQGFLAPVLLIVGFIIMTFILGPLVLSAFVISFAASILLHRIGHAQGLSFRDKMIYQGNRLAVLNEFLQSVRFAKYYVLEEHYQAQMIKHRLAEMYHLRQQKMAGVWNWFVAAGVPCIIAGLVLLFYIVWHGSLPPPEDTFALIASVRFMYLPFAFFGDFLGGIKIFIAAAGRLQRLLLLPEISPMPLEPKSTLQNEAAVKINNMDFSWSIDLSKPTTLKSISLSIPRGQLWCIVGEIGSGKSSLLSSILGHILSTSPQSASSVRASGSSRAYVAQEPMIMNATIRENITFGLDAADIDTELRYEKSIVDAALGADLQILPDGDNTEIGEKGITLSGGQKARIALARAVFSSHQDGLVLLDDPLAAVDAHVGAHLFNECICKSMQGTTRILVTNQLHFLANPAVSKIIVMSQGRIVEEGSLESLLADSGSNLSSMAASIGGIEAWRDAKSEDGAAMQQVEKTDKLKTEDAKSSMQKEREEEVVVTLSTSIYYVKEVGPGVFIIVAFTSWSFHMGELLPDLFLASWQDDVFSLEQDMYVTLWLVLLFLGWVSVIACRGGWVFGSNRAAKKIHSAMLERLLRCPTSFFDCTPSGQIMNRFGEDQSLVDWIAPMMLEVLFLVCFKGFDQLVLPLVVRPQSAPIIVAVLILFMLAREVHRRSNRETIRWWIVTKSPLYHVFEEALAGSSTIFAFCREEYFYNRFEDALKSNLQWNLSKEACNGWANQRFCFLGAFVVAAFCLLMLFTSSPISKSFATVAIIQALMIGENFQWMSYFFVQVEGIFAAVERTRKFIQNLEQEPPWVLANDIDLARSWPPIDSELEFRNVSVRYLPHMPRALDSLTIQIFSSEKVGIVGRTGSGKSTIMGALFRLFPLDDGQIFLGGVDLSTLGLSLLRKRITIVPQDPVLFSGDLKSNLDPLNLHPESELLSMLNRCGLGDLLLKLEDSIHSRVAEGGTNFSVGERQVLCLTRALLRKARVLCLDEATANVDPTNDARMQRILSIELEGCISLTIAHRLNTVLACDRILVLDSGKVSQFAAPRELLAEPGIFQSLATQAGILAAVDQPTVASI